MPASLLLLYSLELEVLLVLLVLLVLVPSVGDNGCLKHTRTLSMGNFGCPIETCDVITHIML